LRKGVEGDYIYLWRVIENKIFEELCHLALASFPLQTFTMTM
jgi:hypothetical protein